MPALKRRGFKRRDSDTPVSQKTNRQLAAECENLATGVRGPRRIRQEWFFRQQVVRGELENHFRERRKAAPPMTDKETKG
jgi:hypothetical protein